MTKYKNKKSVLFVHTLKRSALGLFVFLGIFGASAAFLPFVTDTASAAINDSINFQARLLRANGSVVPDGQYNVEFKIYNAASSTGSSQGSCTGDANCLWTETRTTSNRVRVANGYLTVSLGSLTAFPVNMDWTQNLWLTMNIGDSTLSPTWDGPMNPRLKLTAVPYAMSAAQAARANTLQNATGFASTLGFTTQTAARSIFLPDESGTLCITGSITCGFAPTTGGTGYIQNGLTTQAANFVVQSATVGDAAGTLKGAVGQTADIFRVTNSSDAIMFKVGNTGAVLSKNTVDSATAFDIQNSGGTSMFAVNTAANQVTIGAASELDVFTAITTAPTAPAGAARSQAFSPDGQYLSVAHDGSPSITNYKRSGDTFTKLADPASLPSGNGRGNAWSPDSKYLSVAAVNSPYIYIYKRSGDTFTKLADPASIPTGQGNGTAWSPDGKYMSVTHTNSPYVTIYKRSGDTFTKLANPATLPDTGVANSVKFSPDNRYMVVTSTATLSVTIYKRSGDTFTKLADPIGIPNTTAYGISFTSDGVYMAIAHTSSPLLSIFKIDKTTDTFTKLANPASAPATGTYDVAFSPDGLYLTAMSDNGPNTAVYKRSGDTFTKLATPGSIVASAGRSTAWSPDGKFVSVGFINTPYLTIYRHGTSTVLNGSLEVNSGLVVNGRASGFDAQSNNEFTTLGQVQELISASAGDPNSLLNGGNSFAGAITIGSNDAFAVNFEVGGVTAATINTNGSAQFKNITDSTSAFDIKNASGASLFTADTTSSTISISGSTVLGSTVWDAGMTKLTDPATLPGATVRTTAWSPDNQYVSAGSANAPYLVIYKRSGDTFTKLSDPATAPGNNVATTAWSQDGQYLSVGSANAPYFTIYKRSGDVFTKLSDPATMPGNSVQTTAWSQDTQYLTVGSANAPYFTIYKRSGDVFTKMANPASMPGDSVDSISWSADNRYVSVGSFIGVNQLTIYKRSGDVFTKLTDPASLPGTYVQATAWSPDGQYLSVGSANAPYLTVYKRSGDVFTKITDPATAPGNNVTTTAWSPDGQYLSVGSYLSTADRLSIYKRSGDVLVKLTNPSTMPGDSVTSTAWSPNNQYFVVGSFTNTGRFTIYKANTLVGSTTVNGPLNVNGRVSGLAAQNDNEFTTLGQINSLFSGVASSTNTILNGGNSFGGPISIGSNDAYAVNFKVGGSTAATINTNGATQFKNITDSTTAFSIQNAGGSSLFNVDTTTNTITLGNGATNINIGNTGTTAPWTTGANALPAGVSSGAVVSSNGYAYWLGGYNSTYLSAVYHAKLNSNGTTGAWTTSANSLPSGLSDLSAVANNGYIYALGGYNGSTQTAVYFAKQNADGTIGAWTTSSRPLPDARTAASAMVSNGYVYVAGGFDTSFTRMNTVFYAKLNSDGTTGAWATSANTLPAVRSNASGITINGYLYVIGGTNGSAVTTTYYAKTNADGSTGAWATSANALPAARLAMSVVSNGEYIYTLGGNDASGPHNEVYATRVASDGSIGAWATSANALPDNRQYGGAVMSNGYMYMIGGGNASGPQTTVYYSAALQRNNIGGSTVFTGSVAGVQAQNSNEFTTLGQVQSLMSGLAVAGGTSILQGGNTLGAAITMGTNDAYGVNIKVGGTIVQTIGTDGATTFKNSADSVTAFRVQNAAGTTDVLSVNTVTPGVTINGDINVTGTFSGTKTLFKNTSDSTNAFDIQNASGQSLIKVDTLNNKVTIVGMNVLGATAWDDGMTKLADPSSMPGNIVTTTAWSPDGQYLSVGSNTTTADRFTIYKRSGDTFTKLADPSSMPGNIVSTTAWSPDGQYLSVGSATNTADRFTIYKRSGDTFTKLADPSSLPGNNVKITAWSPDGQYLSVGSNVATADRFTIYKRSGDTFTKLAAPSSMPGSSVQTTAWSPDGQYLSVGSYTAGTDRFTIYKRSGDTFTKLADPTSMPGTYVLTTAWSPDGQYLSVGSATATADRFTIYKRTGDTFTKLADPTTIPGSNVYTTAWSPDGQYLSVGSATTTADRFTIYKRTGDTFTKLADPSSMPGNIVLTTAWSPDGQYLSVGSNTATADRFTIYKANNAVTNTTINGSLTVNGRTSGVAAQADNEYTTLGQLKGAISGAAYLGADNQVFTGSGTTLKNTVNNTNAFTVQTASGTSLLSVNTQGSIVNIGSAGGWDLGMTKLADPSTMPGSTLRATAWSPDGQYLSVGSYTGTADRFTIYKRSGDTFTKLADPATMPGVGVTTTAWSPDGQYLSVGSYTTTNRLTIYKRSGDTFTKLADPATLPGNNIYTTAWSPDGQYLSVGSYTGTADRFTIYKRSGDTFTKLADPASMPGTNVFATAFSPDGQYLSVGSQTTTADRFTIYKRSGDTFTKLANPATMPGNYVTATAWSPDGQYLSVGSQTTTADRFTIYKRSGDTFTKLADPASMPGNNVTTTAWSPDGQYLSVGSQTTTADRFTIYKRSGDTLTKLADPASMPGNNVYATAFSPDGQYLSVGSYTSTADRFTIYKASVVDSVTNIFGTVTIGGSTGSLNISANGSFTLSGEARHTKKITLTPEYTGAVLDASNDASCASANSGTLTGGLDLTNRMNYYNWMSTSVTAQCYNVVVQVPLPSDFDGWATNTPLNIKTFSSNLTNGTAAVELRDSTNTVAYNFVSITPGTVNSWSNAQVGTTLTGTYNADDTITLRIRVTSSNSANLRLGTITMDYLSKY